jgi:hypothetical protein
MGSYESFFNFLWMTHLIQDLYSYDVCVKGPGIFPAWEKLSCIVSYVEGRELGKPSRQPVMGI